MGKRMLGIAVVSALVCSTAAAEVRVLAPASRTEEFRDYWYQGKAELTRYALEQQRYGERRDGDAVLIFVTEDFLSGAQVKFEGHGSGEDAVSVLKLNLTRKFNTGIYPYSMMSSIFTPVDAEATFKVTTTVQEWCGHTYTQLNRRGDGYEGMMHSYFENEADRSLSFDDAALEDDVWTRIRLAPGSLVSGELRLVPGLQFARLSHSASRPERATATVEALRDPELGEGELRRYRVVYRDIPRELQITFRAEFPHEIVAWEERETGAGGTRTTRAVRTHSIRLDYWNRNAPDDARYRALLGLDQP